MSRLAVPESLSNIVVGYGNGLKLECQAVQQHPDNPEDNFLPLNFLDYYDETIAVDTLRSYGHFVLDTVLNERRASNEHDEALELPDIDDVFSFLTTSLDMEPVGSFAYVANTIDAKFSGKTINHLRKSYIYRDRIIQEFGENWPKDLAKRANLARLLHVGAHELTHLAGVQDLIYFSVNLNTSPESPTLMPSGTTLEAWPNIQRGSYLEEGLAVLVSNMYTWDIMPGITSLQKVKEFRSPNGISLQLPERFHYLGHQGYSFCGWGVERLVQLAPDTWDIFMASRKYGARSRVIRNALRKCVDANVPGLFEHIDKADAENLDDIFEVTERIEHAVEMQRR